jgi:hypothetical protein
MHQVLYQSKANATFHPLHENSDIIDLHTTVTLSTLDFRCYRMSGENNHFRCFILKKKYRNVSN